MTDELERLKQELRGEEPIAPSAEAKRVALARAMDAFDEKKSRDVQGSRLADRLKDTASAVFETVIGRRPMKLNPAFAGGASLSVLLVAALSATYIQSSNPKFGAPAPISPLATTPEQTADKTADLKPKPEPGRTTGAKPAEETLKSERRELEIKLAPVREQMQKREMLASRDSAARPRAHVRQNFGQRSVAAAPPPSASAQPQGAPTGGVVRQFYKPKALQDVSRGYAREEQGRDRFETIETNPVKSVAESPVSTFSVDVDTASYSFVRSALNRNALPQKNAVRVEEMINYFPYAYETPSDRSVPFKANVSIFPSPWNAERKLMHVGIAGYKLEQAEKPKSNLVFLLDTSGSMNQANKLPLVINSMKLLLSSLKPDDTVAIVTYAGSAGTLLEPTKVSEKTKILNALDGLFARGSTAGAEGIRQAYALAHQNFEKDGVNRVILATDGDFNVGITNREELKSFVERERDKGITLSVLGFGRGNYNDALMQTLAQNGNGNASYIDTLNEARKVLVEEAGSTLFTIAKDVKLQVEFNPKQVAEYRLIGYETRLLKREDFNNDKVDAGDIGAGHRVTAIYEITPVNSASKALDPLRYQTVKSPTAGGGQGNEYAFLKIRYKLPNESKSKLITTPVTTAQESASITQAPREARFAASVAAFGQILRGGKYTGEFSYDDVIALAQGAKGSDDFGYRAEFINMARLAKTAAALQPLQRR